MRKPVICMLALLVAAISPQYGECRPDLSAMQADTCMPGPGAAAFGKDSSLLEGTAVSMEEAVSSGDFMTIEKVQELTRENYPLVRQWGIIEKNKELELLKAEWGYLPSIVLSAQATYQTEVVEFPDIFTEMFDVDRLSKDQYAAQITFEQKIWDGGDARLKKQVAEASAEVRFRELEVNMYAVQEKVMELYFGVILIEEAMKQTDLFLDKLDANLERMNACYSQGIVSKMDLDKIKVSILEASQQKDELAATRKNLRNGLSLFTGMDMSETELRRPRQISVNSYENNFYRPEYALYDARYSLYENQIKQVDVRKIPHFSFFMSGAYGRPGYDMLDNSFRPYGILGFKMSWSISSFFYTKRVKRLMNYDMEHNIGMARDLFTFELDQKISESRSEIEKLSSMLEKDSRMLELRKSIRSSAEDMAAKGLMSVSEMLDNINDENQAALNKLIHEIELLKAVYGLKYTLNDK